MTTLVPVVTEVERIVELFRQRLEDGLAAGHEATVYAEVRIRGKAVWFERVKLEQRAGRGPDRGR